MCVGSVLRFVSLSDRLYLATQQIVSVINTQTIEERVPDYAVPHENRLIRLNNSAFCLSFWRTHYTLYETTGHRRKENKRRDREKKIHVPEMKVKA